MEHRQNKAIAKNLIHTFRNSDVAYHDIYVESATPDHADPWLLILELVVFEYSPVRTCFFFQEIKMTKDVLTIKTIIIMKSEEDMMNDRV